MRRRRRREESRLDAVERESANNDKSRIGRRLPRAARALARRFSTERLPHPPHRSTDSSRRGNVDVDGGVGETVDAANVMDGAGGEEKD
mmetsp:Transcript_24902/g.72944  ORF Transcript_24902/g.72944 Transcript_24902/m.72944 type:complete len:89 (+) Transcript_24902:79-345(+)